MNSDNEEERAAIEVDLYGIKAQATPRDSGDPPESWREVLRRLNQNLMTICDGTFGLVADTFTAVRNIVRGLGAIPSALATRIAGAHKKAEEKEAAKQAFPERSLVPTTLGGGHVSVETISPEQALDDVLNQLRLNGVHVEIQQLADGKIRVIAVRPELVEEARRLSDKNAGLKEASARAANALRTASIHELRKLSVSAESGAIVLRGTVDSYYHKQLAGELARIYTEGYDVVNELRVEYHRPESGGSKLTAW